MSGDEIAPAGIREFVRWVILDQVGNLDRKRLDAKADDYFGAEISGEDLDRVVKALERASVKVTFPDE